jgi:hypothetical protein
VTIPFGGDGEDRGGEYDGQEGECTRGEDGERWECLSELGERGKGGEEEHDGYGCEVVVWEKWSDVCEVEFSLGGGSPVEVALGLL